MGTTKMKTKDEK